MQNDHNAGSAFALKQELGKLELERAAAKLVGLVDPLYLDDLMQELCEVRAAYIGAAVTEIATLRGVLGDRLQG